MSRNLSADMVTEVTALQLKPIILLKAEFDSGDLNLWTGLGQLTYSGDVYEGAGGLLGVSEVAEVTTIEAQGATLRLAGVPASFVFLALTENYTGRPVTIFFGALDGYGVLIADPIVLYRGRMDVMQIDKGGETVTLSMSCESRLIDLRRAKVRRYTPEDQKSTYPNDRGLDFVAAQQEKEIVWGKNS